MFAAIAILQDIFETRSHLDGRNPEDVLAELVIAAIRVGVAQTRLDQSEGGLFDDYMTLKIGHEQSREGRRKGALSTQEIKAQKRDSALKLAQQIVAVNPGLSNDDLAYRLKSKGSLPFATRTITEWIRAWRADGRLPPLPGR